VLLERIRAAIDIDRQARAATTAHATVIEGLAHLTPRERQVMELLVACKTPKEIAATMNVSVPTVEGHRRLVLAMMEEAES
jgi:FixJ family two-component response regulator